MILQPTSPRKCRRFGFTLLEMTIVLAVIGVLAAIVVPKFASAKDDASAAGVVGQFRTLRDGYLQYYTNYKSWPPDNDGSPGIGHFYAQSYFKTNVWEQTSSIGGYLNWNNFGNNSPDICIHSIGTPNDAKLEMMREVDRILDDGNLNTGGVRWEPDSWGGTLRYWIARNP